MVQLFARQENKGDNVLLGLREGNGSLSQEPQRFRHFTWTKSAGKSHLGPAPLRTPAGNLRPESRLQCPLPSHIAVDKLYPL